MKISIRIVLVFIPVIAVCALLIGMAVLRPAQTHAAGTVAHVTHAVAIPGKITDSAVNLYQCDNGPQSNCSVLTQLNEGDAVQVECQMSGWSKVYAPDYGDTGWVSNNYISATGRVPTCAKQ
ncbi:hypothetical protein KSF_042570 [Reticulibacter mediterranei]|uniref:SH3b domain-containing protein n=1 Tax=Reticulibacter mediterranei TaxID=2778369 RepID=A0A8J3N0G9_9CHLR|nr:SH3 domain-containing protein [Reticulibacter mediterranei]GHO94209.1 hypothetical protein KSF_042570 [Reticulibacter mediterranei]